MSSNCSCTFPKYSHISQQIQLLLLMIHHKTHSEKSFRKYSSRVWWEYSMRNTELSSHQSKNRKFLHISSPPQKSYFNKIQSVIWPLIEKVPEPGLSTKSVNLMIGGEKKNQENTEITSFEYFYPSYVVSQGMVISFFSGSQLSHG